MKTHTFGGKSAVPVDGVCNVAGVGRARRGDVERGVKKTRSGFRLALAAALILTASFQLGSGLERRHLAWAAEQQRGAASGTGPVAGPVATLAKADSTTQARVVQSYGKLPLAFEANQGQTDARVKFLSRGAGYTLFLTGDEAVLSLKEPGGKGEKRPLSVVSGPLRPGHSGHPSLVTRHSFRATDNGPRTTDSILRMKLIGANRNGPVNGIDPLPGKSNYFIGNDPTKWRTNVPTYAKAKYTSVYPGVDLVYYGNQGQLEYDFVVAPGADPSAIRLDVAAGLSRHGKDGGVAAGLSCHGKGGGVKPPLRLDGNGDLLVKVSGGEVRLKKPLVYQIATDNGPRTTDRALVEGRYKLTRGNRVTFELGPYDRTKPLVIDPTVSYSTYLGGSSYDAGEGIAADSSGNAYITGYTQSIDFPVTQGAFQTTCGGTCVTNVFVTKMNASGSALVYSTYLGGSGSNGDLGFGIAVDASGDAYVTGETSSLDFPITPGAFQTTCNGCTGFYYDAFVTEFNPQGSSLVYSTYLGGTYAEGLAIAVDSSGEAYATGASTTDFPVTAGAFQTSCSSGDGTWVTKLNALGTALVYSTYLCGTSQNVPYGIAVDAAGSAYLSGYAIPGFPTTPGAFQTTCPTPDGSSGFVTKFNPSGSALVYSTYLGATTSSAATGIAVDAAGDAYVTGGTYSGFPTTAGAFQTSCGAGDCYYGVAFVSEMNPAGSALVYSTYLGGSSGDSGNDITVAASGDAIVVGSTFSTNFPITQGAFQTVYGGDEDAFVTEFNPAGSALVYSTYLGGSGADFGTAAAVDAAGNSYATGWTPSTNFPVTPGAFQTTCGGGCTGGNSDAFVFKLNSSPSVSLSPSSISFGNQVVGTTSAAQTTTLTNTGDAALNITSIIAAGNNGTFTETSTCGSTLAVGASCTITLSWTPSAAGAMTGAITITDNAPNSPQTVALSGAGVLATVTLSPSSLNFGNQLLGTTSAPQAVKLGTNGPITITSIMTSAEFNQTNNCGNSLSAGSSCTINVTFSPTGLGTQNGTLMVSDSGAGSPQTVSLTGKGVQPAVKLSPTSLTFPTQVVFSSSKPQPVTLTNSGTGTLTLTSITTTLEFHQTNNCGTSVAPGASCTIQVSFGPRDRGPLTGVLTVTDNAPGSPQSVSLAGTGTYIDLSPTSVNFGSQPVGTKSLPRQIAVTNKGGSAVSISSIAITGNDPGDFAQTNNCGASLASGASCFIKVTFTPSAKGKRTADVELIDNGGGSPQTVSLSGTGT